METVVRVAALYVFVLVALRVLGKREFSQLSPFDLVTLLLIPELAQQALVREDFSITNAFVALSTLFLLVLVTSTIAHMSSRAERVIAGSPTVVVSDGRLIAENLNQERLSPSEIYGEMHKAGLHDLAQVRWAILETDGRLSFIARSGDDHPGQEPREEPLPG